MPHRQPKASPGPLAERGVYLHPFIGADGERFVVAVDRFGRRVLQATLYRGDDIDCVVRLLWTFLDERDPTHLTLLS